MHLIFKYSKNTKHSSNLVINKEVPFCLTVAKRYVLPLTVNGKKHKTLSLAFFCDFTQLMTDHGNHMWKSHIQVLKCVPSQKY